MKKAVILLSGGLDSTTVLAYAKSKGYECYCISFDYGQRQRCELNSAKSIAKEMMVKEHIIFKLDINQFGGSALTDHTIDVPDYNGDDKIPITYVPARNLTFLSIALGFAETRDAEAIFIGASSIDYSGYPDCRPQFFKSFHATANLATKVGVEGAGIEIKMPLIDLTKADTIELGLSLNVDYSKTISCYNADNDGRACGTCDSCVLRQKGFRELNIYDPTRYIDSYIKPKESLEV